MNNEEKIVKYCNERDNMGDCYLLKELTEAMCAVIAAARHQHELEGYHVALHDALKAFDALEIE